MNLKKLGLASAIALCSTTAFAAENLSQIIVKADKLETVKNPRVGKSEGAQTISSDYIKAQQASTLADALRKTSSIQVDEVSAQQGSSVFIRGFSQDQISIRVEGAPENFHQVRHGGADRVWIEPDMFKSFTVIPGVASNVYGSGSLGGVLLMETKDPEDIIKPGQDWGAAIRTGIETNADSQYISIDAAKQINKELAVSTTIVTRNTDQYKDGNGDKAVLGATGTDDNNVLVKAVYTPNDAENWEVSYNGMRKDYSEKTTTGSGRFLSGVKDLEVSKNNASISYNLNPKNNRNLDLNVRFSQNEIKRKRRANGVFDNHWAVKTSYAEIENISSFDTSDTVTHKVRYGVDYTRDDVKTAYSTNPHGERNQYGIYLSDTFTVGEPLEFVASLRYDNFKNEIDGLTSSKESAVSPKLSVNWKPFEDTSAYGIGFYGVVGKGFRTPSIHEAISSPPEYSRRSRGYSETIANPKLRGESSNSYEFGVRFNRNDLFANDDQLSLQLGYVDNQAKDYIDKQQVGTRSADVNGDGRAETIKTNQYRNVDRVKINGIEVSVNYTNSDWFTALTAQSMDGTYDSGDNKGRKLSGISPTTANFSIGKYILDGKGRAGVDVSHRGSREFYQRGSNRFRKAFTTYDVFMSNQLSKNVLVQARIENLLNKQYSKNTLLATPTVNDTRWAPGRNIKLTLEYKF